MLESGTPGARYLKAARKLTGQGSGDTPWKAAPVAQIFSVEAMSRMGFDPVSGMQFVPVLQKKAKTAAEHAQAACALAVDGNGMVELDFDSD
ncbi:hypothetical protein HKX48_004220 [Thoreauomyces humboldtii]|nr:hypothetical protein HKX48_004220 [Thoreauomyces humboldtii]